MNRCGGIGYKGRIGIYELLKFSPSIRQAIGRNEYIKSQEIEEIAVSEGMLTLKEYGIKLIQEQQTTVSEVHRVIGDRS